MITVQLEYKRMIVAPIPFFEQLQQTDLIKTLKNFI